ncbi:hypothetical protein IGI04_001383 [Brassica rapa subsp. trilocularis]|uniref:Protein kinase domain-containing protein n=1 Tax=Brassica rapa subsp. trilocularis TaxID=1813537 RepID=A0ABQ7NTC8_BRACM|nr:hypothetical protein IGI04_001383 [Brassica rapa subsp. trilocularis]
MQTLSPQSLRWKSNPLIVSESYVFNPKALNFQASSLSSPYRRTRNWRISSSSEENAANSSDGGDLKKSLSGIVGNQVEELLSREENKSLLDGLEKASMRVETAKRELAEIVRQELEAKLLQDYVDKLESRAAEIAECQQEIIAARTMVEEAERSLSLAETPATESSENGYSIDKDKERLESAKAAAIAAAVGTVAEVPFALSQVSSIEQLVLPLGVAFASCALFGVTFRYVIRRDLDDSHLKSGAVAAFGFVKGLGMLSRGPPLELSWESLLSHGIDGAVLVSQSVLIFAFASISLDFCFKLKLLKPFPSSAQMAVFGGKRRKKMVRGSSSSGGAVVRGGSSVKQRGFSMNPKDYKLMEEVGHGASAVVYRAIYLPTNEVIAVKCLDLDRCNSNLDDVRRESQTMSLIDHPNVIKSFCSFSVDHSLWVVMPFMAQGSCLHLMKTAYSDGFEESAICSILKETLKALDYLHKQGHIHRDVKAGNILLDDNGEIKLGDFGVSACLFDNGDRQRARNTFVGWHRKSCSPEMDIIPRLISGRLVLLMTIQNAPPGLDYDRDKKFSKRTFSCEQSFKEMVAMCLVKDQTKRPTAEKLLKHSCFKNTKPPELAVKSLFADLPPLWTRVRSLQAKDAAQLALKRMATADEEAISMSEYQRGVSAWNFDVKDLKTQASLLSDDDGLEESQEDEEIFHTRFHNKVNDSPVLYENMNGKEKVSTTEVEEPNCEEKFTFITNASSVTPNSEQEVSEAKVNKPVRRQSQSGPLTSRAVVSHSASEKGQIFERSESEHQAAPSVKRAPSFSGPLNLSTRASSNSLSAPIKYSGGFRDSLDEKSKGNLVQKGRFSVTSGNLDLAKDVPLSIVPRRSPQSSPLRKSASVGNWIPEPKIPTVQPQTIKELSSQPMSPSLIIPQLQHIFQQNSVQQDLLMNLLNSVQPAETADGSQSGKLPPLPRSETNGTVDSVPSERERMLLSSISELRAKLNDLTEELDSEKSRYNQLQQKLKAFTGRELV